MSDWTKKSFYDLRDQSPRDAPMQWKLARGALRSPELGLSRFTYEPGARMPFGHRHREQEEVYVVVADSGRAKLDDGVIELSTWDVLRVAPTLVRLFGAGPGGLDLVCIGGRKPTTPSESRTSGTDAKGPPIPQLTKLCDLITIDDKFGKVLLDG